jgi:hypothetical protein
MLLFVRPLASDIEISLDLLSLFGEAKTNVQKSNVFPIQCSEDDITAIQNLLPCELKEFPCKYLGAPLSLKSLSKAQLQPYIDRITARLPSWKVDLLSKEGRQILVQHVLTSMLMYLAMAIDLPPWIIKSIDKIRKGLWRGRKEAKGGHCVVAWLKCASPKSLVVWEFLISNILVGLFA